MFKAGGCGASYDLGTSEVLGNKITESDAEGILLVRFTMACWAIFQSNSGFRVFFETLTLGDGNICNAHNWNSSWINNPNSKTYLAVGQYLNFNQNASNIYRRSVC